MSSAAFVPVGAAFPFVHAQTQRTAGNVCVLRSRRNSRADVFVARKSFFSAKTSFSVPRSISFSTRSYGFSVAADASVKLFAAQRSRSSIVSWFLEELGIPYEKVDLNLKEGENKTEAYSEIHPFQQVPALQVTEDGKTTNIFESGAILSYLANKFDKTVAWTPEHVATVNQWVIWANASMATGLFMEQSRDKVLPKLIGTLDKILSKQPFILGDKLSAADVAIGSYLYLLPQMIPAISFDQYPAVVKYIKDLTERPAFKKTIGNR